jgi:hypothetical protein
LARLLEIASATRPPGVLETSATSAAVAGLPVAAGAVASGVDVPARPAKNATIAARSVSAGTRMRSLGSSPRPSVFGVSAIPGHAAPGARPEYGAAVESGAREDVTGAGSITVAAGGCGGGSGGA